MIRSWKCQNKACWNEFDAQNDNPACPACGCIRTNWIPKPVNIGKTASGLDKVVRDLANDFKMKNVPTVQAGETVKGPATQGVPISVGGMQAMLGPDGRAGVVNFNTKAKLKGGLGTVINQGGDVLRQQHTTTVARDK